MADIDAAPEQEIGTKVATVAGTILNEYFDALGAIDGFDKIATSLRETVADKGVSNEAAIRAAIFGDSSA